MADPALILGFASTGVAAVAMTAGAALKGWQGWLEVKKLELARQEPSQRSARPAEISELRDRLRKLEAIANGSAGAGGDEPRRAH